MAAIFRTCLAFASLLITAGVAAGQSATPPLLDTYASDASGMSWEPTGVAMHTHASRDGSWDLGAHWSAFVLGPVAYLHRTSASANPISPISHHWLDATHISFGVVTAGLHGKTWKVEASLFN